MAAVWRASAVGTVLLLVGIAPTSGQDPSGTWTTTFVKSVTQRGTSADTVWATGELSLTFDGNRLVGTWKGVGTWRVEGTFDAGRLRLWSTGLQDGDPRLRQIERMDWEAVLQDERLEGVQRTTLRGRPAGTIAPFPWRGERKEDGRPGNAAPLP